MSTIEDTNHSLNLELAQLRSDLETKKKANKALVSLISNIHIDRDKLKNEVADWAKQHKEILAEKEKADDLLRYEKYSNKYKIHIQQQLDFEEFQQQKKKFLDQRNEDMDKLLKA